MERIRANLSEFLALAFIVSMITTFSLPSLIEMGRESRAKALRGFYVQLSYALQHAPDSPLAAKTPPSDRYEPYPAYPRNVLGLVPPHHELVVQYQSDGIIIAHRGTAPQDREACSLRFSTHSQLLAEQIHLMSC